MEKSTKVLVNQPVNVLADKKNTVLADKKNTVLADKKETILEDMTCLAEGMVFPASFVKTGINSNELVVGPTGCGKSMSNAYSRLVHTFNSSVVVPIAKSAIKENFIEMFKERGYEVVDLDYAHPENSIAGYDPMDYIKSDEDVVQTARNLVGLTESKSRVSGNSDPYWNDSATSVLAAEISYVRIMAEMDNKKACFSDVIELHHSMNANTGGKIMKNSLDPLFDELETLKPGNQASKLWGTIQGLSSTTASCILSIVNNAIDKVFSKSILALCKKEDKVSFYDLGKKKTALFITTSPMNLSLQNFINLMYADMFRALFEAAEANEEKQLDIPVHIICDDFACGSKISDFEDYISIFRAAGISVTMLLQSETQLTNMYGETAATTIINNCDTYVYMGGMDIRTCRNISQRINKSLKEVSSIPLETVIVFRRGSEYKKARRYQIMSDPLYLDVLRLNAEKRADSEHI